MNIKVRKQKNKFLKKKQNKTKKKMQHIFPSNFF